MSGFNEHEGPISKSLRVPRAVIFDWDNTLVDSWSAIINAVNYTRGHFGMLPWTIEESKSNITRSARDSFPEWFGDHSQEALDLFYERFAAVQMENFVPLPGSVSVLAWLKEQGIPCVVVSNKNGNYLRREAEVLGWNHYFASIVGATDALRDKPAREVTDYALQLAGLTAGEDVWFVGDSETDVVCARRAHCTPILIGNHDSANQLGVDIYVADCHELLELLKRAGRAIA